jgi:hypothetical protein
MAVKADIGKNTLGGGKKMEVYMHEYNRSTHDLSYTWRNTQAPGTLVPFMCEVALPGDTWYINLRTQMLTHPTLGPLFGSFKQQNDIFLCPIRLYNALLHNNTLNVGMDMSAVKLPKLEIKVDQKDSQDLEGSKGTLKKQINPSCLLAYLGIRSVAGYTPGSSATSHNATTLIAYYDIFKNYYANKQEKKFFTIGVNTGELYQASASTSAVGWTTGFYNYTAKTGEYKSGNVIYTRTAVTAVGAIGLGDDNDFPEQITVQMYNQNTGQTVSGKMTDFFDISETANKDSMNYYPVKGLDPLARYTVLRVTLDSGSQLQSWLLENIDEIRELILSLNRKQFIINGTDNKCNLLNQFVERDNAKFLKTSHPQFGLALKTYQSDIFTNWVQTEWIDGDNGINAITAIDTSAGNFSLDTLNLSQKVYDMLNRIAISDGSYNSWIRTVYTSGGVPHYETPVYMGGSSSEIEFQEVVSNAATYDQPLGSLAGRGVDTRHKGGEIKIKVDEPCYILGITSITPRVDYFQGNRFYDIHNTLNDLHKPALDGIGFQDRLYWTLNANLANQNFYKSIGKQPAWIDYMTNFNRTYGNFAILENEGWMCLNRVFKDIENYTTYINPQEYNGIFADTDLDAMNFWSQIHVDAKVRRVMSAKQIPNL